MSVPVSLLAAAIPRARLTGRAAARVSGLCADSRALKAGDAFACVRGAHADGHAFAADAVARGAAAVICEREVAGVDVGRAAVIRVPDVARALTEVAPKWYGQPSLDLRMVGVTGTNGKTTLTYLVRSILESRKAPARPGRAGSGSVGIIGTIQHAIGSAVEPSHNTTPPAWDVQRLLGAMVAAGCRTAVLEVSSHALAQERITGCEFDVAVFTNLTRDHLDFHRTLGRYAAAKKKLFRRLVEPGFKGGPKFAVTNADDPYGREMVRAAPGARVVTYGLAHPADFSAENLDLTATGCRFRLRSPLGTVEVRLPLVGRFNVVNALAAAATAHCLGVGLPAIRRGLESTPAVPGRMQRVPGAQPFLVLVDFAHTPDALEQALTQARGFTRGRVIVVFGCGGERDAGKRAPMGGIAARLADEIILTSDNPRSEDPSAILGQVQAGCRRQGKEAQVFVDRHDAIRQALRLAKPGDTVLLAGKGHETYQVVGTRVLPFNDAEVASRFLKSKSRLNSRVS